jgi:hypothetical protein
VADVGCGIGGSTIIMAEAFERSAFAGFQLGGVLGEAGFTRVRTATKTPFNLVLEARS